MLASLAAAKEKAEKVLCNAMQYSTPSARCIAHNYCVVIGIWGSTRSTKIPATEQYKLY